MEAFVGFITGLVVTALISGFLQDQSLPSSAKVMLVVIGLIVTFGSLFALQKAGFGYLTGWLFISWLMKDAFTPVDWILFIVLPAGLIIAKIIYFVRKNVY